MAGKCAAILVFLAVTMSAVPVDSMPDIWLEISGLNANIPANRVATLSTADFDSFRIIIAKQTSEISYGSVFAKINTESANIVMTVGSRPEGIVCNFDLSRRGGFRLRPGRNSVEIAYFDRRQRIHYASFVLNAGAANTPTHFAGEQPERLVGGKYAVVVGISKYRNSGTVLRDLKFPDRDARAFYEFLVSPLAGFRSENVKLLLNESASSENLHRALFDFLGRAQPEDLVVFFFAGNGGADATDPKVASGKTNLYLLTSDFDPADVKQTAFAVSDLQDFFDERLKSRRAVTIVDACRTLTITAGASDTGAKQNNLLNQYLARYAGAAQRAVITASDISEVSLESEQWGNGHGVFTHYLLQGLKGDADLNKDGVITVGELFPYVRDHVYKATVGAQRPVADAGMARNLAIANLSTFGAAKKRCVSATQLRTWFLAQWCCACPGRYQLRPAWQS